MKYERFREVINVIVKEMNDDAMTKFENSAAELNMTDKEYAKHIGLSDDEFKALLSGNCSLSTFAAVMSNAGYVIDVKTFSEAGFPEDEYYVIDKPTTNDVTE